MTTTPVTINNFMDVLQGLVDGYPRNDDFMYDLDDLAEREYDIHCNGVPETDFVRRQRDALLNDILSIYNFDPHQIVQTPDGDVTVWDVVIDNVYTYMNNHVTFE